jgi:hypothetical protein
MKVSRKVAKEQRRGVNEPRRSEGSEGRREEKLRGGVEKWVLKLFRIKPNF